MKIGTYYYPEQWPREQWQRDFDTMAALGLQIVHMGEFAWFDMEPAEGDIQLDWLSQCVEMAQKQKLDVILCTPTAAPPIWLVEKHPEILPLDAAGKRARFGGRRHYSPTAPALHDATRRIVAALAKRFGDHPAVIGWQIDNEYSSDFLDQNDHAITAWRAWLIEKYASPAALNKAWGCQFWNTYYTDWSQIAFPPCRDPKYGNPHQVLDASRFWSHAFARFNRLQAEILKPAIGQRFVTSNLMPFHHDVNPADLAKDVSLMSWDAYPCPGMEKSPRDQSFRVGDPSSIGLMHDYMASFHGRWAQMELQPGQVNWGAAPVQLYPGVVRLWLWTALAHGAEFTTTYRLRQPRFGIELFHQGLVGLDGVTPSVGGRQFQQTIDEIGRLDLKLMTAPQPAQNLALDYAAPAAAGATAAPAVTLPTSTVGLVVDFDQLWYFKILPQARRWDYPRLLKLWYGALARLGLSIKILRPDQPWPAGLPVIVAPALQMVEDSTITQMTQYASNGGHLVLTCRTALMDRTGQLFEGPLAKPILPLIGGNVEAYDGLPDGLLGKIEIDGKLHDWGVWGDLLYAEENTKVLAKYADQFYGGAAAVIQHKIEKGVVTYCGVFGEESFTDALAEKIATQAKLTIAPLPSRVHVLRRGPYRILLNYSGATVEAPAAPRTRFVVGTRKVEPAGVAVWKDA